MTNDELEALAVRVESLTGPDREVDCLAHFLTDGKWVGRIPTWPPTKISRPSMERGLTMHIEGDAYFYGDEVPPYTASIDAAMTLVPEGWHCGMGRDGNNHGPTRSWAWVRYPVSAPCNWKETGTVWAMGQPALALTAASLRARKTP